MASGGTSGGLTAPLPEWKTACGSVAFSQKCTFRTKNVDCRSRLTENVTNNVTTAGKTTIPGDTGATEK
jgi:hypothetical protein